MGKMKLKMLSDEEADLGDEKIGEAVRDKEGMDNADIEEVSETDGEPQLEEIMDTTVEEKGGEPQPEEVTRDMGYCNGKGAGRTTGRGGNHAGMSGSSIVEWKRKYKDRLKWTPGRSGHQGGARYGRSQ